LLDIHPESNKKIDYQGGPHGKERKINKIFTDGCGGNAHSLSNGCANSKHMPLDKVFQTVHTLN
jgi:hypothetical protein